MLKSLYAGVSGLQSHQIAMDVESNNIANVNTTGFKYSRANFSDLLAQTKSIATAPQGELGGKNAVQVGLGSTVGSMTTIYSQGSIQNSDKNTDVAIQGDGFFIVSPDGGNSYKYTRAGDFKFDANGNFVDNNGFIVQGWIRDSETGKVDATAPIENITIPPGLTTPASPTTDVVLKANLNAGILVESYSPAYEVESGNPPAAPISPALDSNGNPIASGDLGVMFNDTGEALSLQENQGVWASFLSAEKTDSANNSVNASFIEVGTVLDSTGVNDGLDITLDGLNILVAGVPGNLADDNGALYASEINSQLIASGRTGISAIYDSGTNELTIVNTNATAVALTGADYGKSGMGDNAQIGGNQLDITFELDNGDPLRIQTSGGTGTESVVENASRYVSAINAQSATTGISATYDTVNGKINLVNDNSSSSSSHNIRVLSVGANSGLTNTDVVTAYRYQYSSTTSAGGDGGAGADKTFKTISDLRYQLELEARNVGDGDTDGTPNENNISIIVNEQGKLEITNPGGSEDGDYTINLAITGMNASSVFGGGITENVKFTKNLEALNSNIPAGTTSKAFSQSFNAATHSSSIDIYDSLGSKHTLRTEFRKTDVDKTTGVSTWDMLISVPPPADISGSIVASEVYGQVRFQSNGSYLDSTPPNVSFSGNNGSTKYQPINLDFGTNGLFDGMTSFDSASSTSGISQDGFTGGDLVGIRIDQSGTIVGSFSNGRSFGLAQVGMAKFTNNEGLSTEGGSVYVQTANSGDPIIGSAATSGRGFIQSSALEASNVDLSRSLTQLIIIQRGYQANGKTITTSDTLLETLIGLKR